MKTSAICSGVTSLFSRNIRIVSIRPLLSFVYVPVYVSTISHGTLFRSLEILHLTPHDLGLHRPVIPAIEVVDVRKVAIVVPLCKERKVYRAFAHPHPLLHPVHPLVLHLIVYEDAVISYCKCIKPHRIPLVYELLLCESTRSMTRSRLPVITRARYSAMAVPCPIAREKRRSGLNVFLSNSLLQLLSSMPVEYLTLDSNIFSS